MRDLIKPTISVVIAAREASRYVAATLESLVGQTELPKQVVLYDDGSTDNTAEIASRFADRLPMLTVIKGEKPVGISAARNRANAAAKTDYIAVLDADDLFRPATIWRYVDFLRKHPETDLLYADTLVFNSDLTRGGARRYPKFRTAREAIRRTLGSPLIPFKHSSMVYRRKAIEEIGGYDESLPIKVDIDLFLRFQACRMKVAKLDRTTSIHRKHKRQISTNRLGGIKAYIRLIQFYEPDPIVRGLLFSTRIPSEFLKLMLRG